MIRMRVMFLSGCALAVLLGAASAGALLPEQRCEANKLEATARYHRCLTDAMRKTIVQGGAPSDDEIARCDRQLDRAFEHADEHADCYTPGAALSVRNAIKEQVQATFTDVVAASGPCAALHIDQGYAICGLSQSQSSIDLTAMLDQINSNPSVTTTVNGGTTLWVQVWGGHGGYGAGGNAQGHGHDGGYAQMTTTVDDIHATYGVTELYYYLGKWGDPRTCVSGTTTCGGNGGSATFVTSEDATIAFNLSNTLLAAGGGGGGGAGTGEGAGDCLDGANGLNGGAGATAISGLGADKRVSGDDGEQKSDGTSGQGGGSSGNGGPPGSAGGNGSAKAGDDEFAPIGGIGGKNTSTSVGFINVPDVVVRGHGGAGGKPDSVETDAPGGGGGGGLAGGGGGVEATGKICSSGGGGGGSSLARASTRSCRIAPTTIPSNPNGSTGYVRIGIDLGGC